MRKMFSKNQIQEMINQAKQEIIEEINTNGVNKVKPQAIVGLTDSFSALDETLQALIESAIDAGGDAVACTQAQWNSIKEFLDECLYLNYSGYSLIKTATDGIGNYIFGSEISPDSSYSGYYYLELSFDEGDLRVIPKEL